MIAHAVGQEAAKKPLPLRAAKGKKKTAGKRKKVTEPREAVEPKRPRGRPKNAERLRRAATTSTTTTTTVLVIPDVIDEAGPSTDTSIRPRRLTRAPSRFNDGASESESDSDLSDAEVDDELRSNGDASEDEEEDAALAATFAEAAGALRPIQSK